MLQSNRLWAYLVFPRVHDPGALIALRATCRHFRSFLDANTAVTMLHPRMSWHERAAGFAGVKTALARCDAMRQGKLREVRKLELNRRTATLRPVCGRLVGRKECDVKRLETRVEDDVLWICLPFDSGSAVRWREVLLDRFVGIVHPSEDETIALIDCLTGAVLPVAVDSSLVHRSLFLSASGYRFNLTRSKTPVFELSHDFSCVQALEMPWIRDNTDGALELVDRGTKFVTVRNESVALIDVLTGATLRKFACERATPGHLDPNQAVEDFLLVPCDEEQGDGTFCPLYGRVIHLRTGQVGAIIENPESLTRRGNVVTDKKRIIDWRSTRIVERYGRGLIHDAATGLFVSNGKDMPNSGREVVFEGEIIARLPLGKEHFNYSQMLLNVRDGAVLILYSFL